LTETVDIHILRPNKWFLVREKVEKIRAIWSIGEQHKLPEVLVAVIESDLSLIDGHCRTFVAWENGSKNIKANVVNLNQLNGNKELLTIFHKQAPRVGVRNIADLSNRIFDLAEDADPDLSFMIGNV
jgi:hypothetical protein